MDILGLFDGVLGFLSALRSPNEDETEKINTSEDKKQNIDREKIIDKRKEEVRKQRQHGKDKDCNYNR